MAAEGMNRHDLLKSIILGEYGRIR